MKKFAIIFLLIIFAFSAFGQKPKPTSKKTPQPAKTVAPTFGTEKEELDKAVALPVSEERITVLREFIQNFPESAEIPRVKGLIVSTQAALADLKLQAGDMPAGIELFKLAISEVPTPIDEKLFTQVILGFPISLYSRNQRGAAFDIVKLIEEKVGANANQILDLAKFFINVEYGTEAIRLAEKAVEIAPDSAVAYQTLAIAYRLNFRLEDAANSYSKALEFEKDSLVHRQNLAEMKRALGKADEAIALYREILTTEETNVAARTGLILSLFDAGKRKEAEAELTKSLEANPNNLPLLVGVSYWYAAKGEGVKAVDFSQKAIVVDPRNVWAYIAQARGFMAQKKPLEAEKVLLIAKNFQDFPTLDYELANARLAAGFYRDAIDSLAKNFAVNKDGKVETYLGNRILADADSFTELLSLERRSVLFQVESGDRAENAQRLKKLLEFYQRLQAEGATEEEIANAAEEFVKGNDNMRLHRQIFAANLLLQKQVALPKVAEMMQSAIGSVDNALNVESPSAAVLSDAIYENRQLAISRNQIIVVPEIPRQTLSAILRGRIEDILGWTFYYQKNPSQAVVRFKRALSVLPAGTAWWRVTQWHLGAALQADGKEKEALDAYIKAYDQDNPDTGKRLIIEGLYEKVNGNLDGLDARIGARPDSTTVAVVKTPTPTPTPEKLPENLPIATTEPTQTPTPTTETTPTPEVSPSPTPQIEEVKTEETPIPSPTPSETVQPTPEITPSPTPETTPTPEITPEVTPTPETKTEPDTQIVSEVKSAENKETVKPQEKPTPKPLFEPIIITIPKNSNTPKVKTEETKTEEKPTTETVKTPEKTNSETDNSGETRPRLIIINKTEETAPCKIVVSQDNVSLLGGGGSLGVLVGFEGEGDFKEITAMSSNPEEVEVTLETGIGENSKRLFFIIKSLSTKIGEYTVIFQAPCGKKEILVKVR